MPRSFLLLSTVALASLAACSPPEAQKQAGASQPAPTLGPSNTTAAPAGGAPPTASGPLSPAAVNGAQFDAAAASTPPSPGQAPQADLIRAEVLLDRAHFSPGVIDGKFGENVKNAVIAYSKAHNLPTADALTPQLFQTLTAADKADVLKTYTLTPQDAAGPFSANVGEDFVKMAQQPSLGYTSPQEMLAERFHMDEGFLRALNPGADFSKAGTSIVVVDPGPAVLPGEAARLEVDKKTKSVTAFAEDDSVLAVFPATVGSTERPSPHGTWKVKGVAQNPDYVYDPKKLTWGPKKAGKLHIPPGPNNPVGVVWIALTAPDYGIHGTPDPHVVGKTASHGCVRLTNWDAEELSKAVKPGVKVTFVTG